VLGDTIYSSVSQLIMFPISPEWRGRAKGFLDGVVRNGAKGVAAVSLIVLSQWITVHQFSYLIIALIACCIYAAIRIKSAYLKMLLATLQTREINLQDIEFDLVDPASIQLLINALRSPEKLEAIYALRMLKRLEQFDLNPYIAELLRHSVKEVQIEALKYIQQTTPSEGEHELEPLLQSSDLKVKSNAIMALSAYAQDDQLERITGFLEASEVKVKSAAIAGLIKYYGIEGMFHAVGTLKGLIESKQEDERIAMASLFGKIGIAGFYKPLIPLLEDPSTHVQNYALKSAAVLRVPELVPLLIPLLQQGATRQRAIEALSAYEEKVILPLLVPYLASDEAIIHLPIVFERIGTKRAFDILLHNYDPLSSDLREKALESLVRMYQGIGKVDTKLVERYILEEVSLYWGFIEHGKGLGEEDEFAEAFEAVEQIKAHILVRIFQLLSLIYEAKTVYAIQANWGGNDVRQQANAAEVVDQLLQGALRTEMTKIMLASPIKRTQTDLNELDISLTWLYSQKELWLNQVIQLAAYQSLNKPQWQGILALFEVAATKTEQSERSELLARVKLLKNVSLFQGLSGKELSKIAQYLIEEHIVRGDIIIRELEEGSALYLIQTGKAAVYRNEVLVGTLNAGECFGEMGMLIQSKRTATVIAEGDMQIFRLDSTALYEMIFDRTTIALEMMKLLSRRLRTALARIDSAEAVQNEADLTVNINIQTGITQINNEVILRRILVLQKISLFAHFSQEDFIRLAHMVEEVEYEPEEVICKTGEAGDTMYGIIKGNVKVHRGSELLAALSVGECFGEMAIIDGDPRSADCTATERTLLLQLTRDQVMGFCFQQMNVLKSMMRVLAERLKDMQERV
jgi:CRP-like cAMP-binding protein/HEAT repeat protein